MDLISEIIARAKANKQRIVLPEGTEERTLKAADQLLADEVAELILIGNPSEIKELADKFGLTNIGKATIIDPENHPKKEEYAELLCELRKKKGMTIEELGAKLNKSLKGVLANKGNYIATKSLALPRVTALFSIVKLPLNKSFAFLSNINLIRLNKASSSTPPLVTLCTFSKVKFVL